MFQINEAFNNQSERREPSEFGQRVLKNPFHILRCENSRFPIFKESGSWSHEEVLKHALFVESFYATMLQDKQIRGRRMFYHLADFVGTRNFNQCRSFHQRAIQKYGSLSAYLTSFRSRFTKFTHDFSEERAQLNLLTGKIFRDFELQQGFSVSNGLRFQKFHREALIHQLVGRNIQDSHFNKQMNEDKFATDAQLIQEENHITDEKSRKKNLLLTLEKFRDEQDGMVQNSIGIQGFVNPYLKMKMQKSNDFKTHLPNILVTQPHRNPIKQEYAETNNYMEGARPYYQQ